MVKQMSGAMNRPIPEKPQLNIWQGEFPNHNTLSDGYRMTAPVKSFPPNGYGLYDMAGNVWEWCSDWYDNSVYSRRSRTPGDRQSDRTEFQSSIRILPFMPLRSQRGGSFLCCDSYCTSLPPQCSARGNARFRDVARGISLREIA